MPGTGTKNRSAEGEPSTLNGFRHASVDCSIPGRVLLSRAGYASNSAPNYNICPISSYFVTHSNQLYMTSKDLSKLANKERSISEHLSGLGINGLSDLENFPFTHIGDIDRGYKDKSISLGANYEPDLLDVYGTSLEIALSRFFSMVPILIVLGNIILAIVHKQWTYLLGVVFALVGLSLSSPHAPMRRLLGLGGIVAFVWMAIAGNWVWATVIASFLLSLIATRIVRAIYSQAMTERALKSEIMFCYMFLTKKINVRDNVSGTILIPQS